MNDNKNNEAKQTKRVSVWDNLTPAQQRQWLSRDLVRCAATAAKNKKNSLNKFSWK